MHGLKSGKALKEFRGHTSYVNSACFSPDGSRVLSASSDATVRVWDAKSCDCLAAFKPPQPASGTAELPVNSVAPLPGSPDQLVVCNRSPTLYVMTMQVWRAAQPASVEMAHPSFSRGRAWMPLLSCTPRAYSRPHTPGLPCFCPNTPLPLLTHARLIGAPAPAPPQGQVVKSLQSGKRVGGDFVAAAPSPRGGWLYALGEDGSLYCFSPQHGKLEHLLQVADKGPIGVVHHPHRSLVATFADDGALKIWKP